MTSPSPPRRRRRVVRVVAASVALLILALAWGEATGWPFLRQQIAQRLTAMAGVPVLVAAPFRVQLLGAPRLSAARLSVGARAGLDVPHLLDASQVVLTGRWRDVWATVRGAPIRVQELTAATMDAHLVRDPQGRASWQIGANANRARPADARPAPVLERLAVRHAKLHIDDRMQALQLTVQVEPAQGQGEASDDGVEISATGRYRDAPVRAALTIDNMLPLLTRDVARERASNVAGQAVIGRAEVRLAGRAASLATTPWLQGQLMIKGPSLAMVASPLGLTLPETPPFQLDGSIGREGPVWHLDADRFVVGTSRLGGRFAYDKRREPPRLSGELTGQRLALRDLGPSIHAQTPPQRRGRVLPDRAFNVPSLRAMDAEIEVAIDTLDFGSAAMMPLSELRSNLTLRSGKLQLEHLSAQVAGGSVEGATSLQAGDEAAQWQARLDFSGIALSQWVRALQPAAAAGSEAREAPLPLASGRLNARIELTGRGRNVADILASADGQLQASLRDAALSHLVTEVAGLDLAQALGVALAGDRSLALRCAWVQARVHDGVATPLRGLLDNVDSSLHIDGRADLRDESLALRVIARPKDFSPLSFRSPLRVSGTLAEPRVSVEPSRLAPRALAALALAAAAPVLAWLPFVEGGEESQQDPCATLPAAKANGKPGSRSSPPTPSRTKPRRD